MDASRRLSQAQIVAAVAVPTLTVLLVGMLALSALRETHGVTDLVARAHEASGLLGEIRGRLVDAETAQRGYLLTGDESFLSPYALVRSDLEEHFTGLRLLTLDEEQRRRLETLPALIEARLELIDENIALHQQGDPAVQDAARFMEARRRMEAVLGVIAEIDRSKDSLIVAREAAAVAKVRRLGAGVLLGALAAVLMALLTFLLLVRHARAREQLTSEVEGQNQQLQDQTLELEMQSEELGAQAAQLEETMAELEMSNDELQRLNEEAGSARRLAEEANLAKTEFLSAMSHELRTPLNAIAGYVDLMEAQVYGEVGDAQRIALERMRLNQKSLLVLINDILHYARIEGGHLEPEIDDVDAGELVTSLEPLIAPQVRQARLTCLVHPPPAGVRLRADRERTRQILLNLLTNAIKFTPEGGRIELACAQEGSSVSIRVSDTGRGIPADMVFKVFDPFVQVERNRHDSSVQGVGLGLAISRELAEQMGGAIAVESALGAGSTFVLTLPAGEPVTEGSSPPRSSAAAP
jgi:signal transduction histidine kinase